MYITKMAENKEALQKPFLKWVGGKTQMIDTILTHIPSTMNNYHELFVGGGSVLLAVLSRQKQNKIAIRRNIFAYDANAPLIALYQTIQTNPGGLFNSLSRYWGEYDRIGVFKGLKTPASLGEALSSKESYYYWLRNIFNTTTSVLEHAALFVFLNKTCFRGMYREGPRGFNVPFGHYKTTPRLISLPEWETISVLIQNVRFVCTDFTTSIKNVKRGDYVYLDPPYAPENTKSFVGYTAAGFNLAQHKKLFAEIVNLGEQGAKFTLSNARVPLVLEYFQAYPYEEIVARRTINSRNPASTTTELLISNY